MDTPEDNLLSLKLRSFIAAFRAESAALWFLCLYIFIEYIRPQDMYPVIDVLPWGQVSILLALISLFVTGAKASNFNAMDKLFTLMTLVVILSCFFAWSPADSFKEWSTYTSWVLMYFCITSTLSTPNRMLLFVIFFVLVNFKLSQHGARTFAMRGFSFTRWGLAGSPGWFHNSGEFALQMVVTFSMSITIILAAKKYFEKQLRWWIILFLFPGTAALVVIGSSSRGGQIALATVLLILFLRGRNFFRKIILLTVVINLGMYFLPDEQIERFNTMGDDKTSELRLMHWEHAEETIAKNPMGIGYKNWIPYYYVVYNPELLEEIHNSVLQAYAELGYHGGTLFLLMVLTAFVMNMRTIGEMKRLNGPEAEAMAAVALGVNLSLLGTFIAALFMSVLYYPMFWVAFALTSALRNIARSKLKEPAYQPDNEEQPPLPTKSAGRKRKNRTGRSRHGKLRHNYR